MRIGEATNKTDLVSALEEARSRRLDMRRGFETRWWNNIALVAGDHFAKWNPTMSAFEDRDPTWVQGDDKKPRLVINHALTVGRTELSKLTKSQPIMEVIANSDEQKDIAATKVGRAGLDYAEWKFRLKKKRKQALWWMIQTGLGAIYVGWDYLNDDAGEMTFTIDPSTGDPVFNPVRIEALKEALDRDEIDELREENYPLGEVEYRVFSPFQLLPDETADDFESLNDLITTEVADVDVIKGLYDREARDLKPDGNLQVGVIEARMQQLAGVPGGIGAKAGNVDNGKAIHTYWLLPNVYRGNKFLKDGIYVRWCDQKTVLDISSTFPFQDGRMPFVFFQHIPSTATIWPDCVMNHIRGPNLEIDKTVSQLIENKDYMANPMWRIATQHRIKGEVRNVAGAIVRYRHVPNVPPPEPVQGLSMPNQVENLLAGLRDQILDISGQSEVSRGRVPSGARSGVAVAYLQEEDDSRIAPTVENMEESIALMGSLTLERFSQFYVFDRILRFYRRDGIFDVRRFKGADLKNNTDVVCQAGSAMPRSKASRHEYTLELIQVGVLKDPHKIMEMLELGYGEPDDTDKAIAQANRENNMMLSGRFLSEAQPDRADHQDDKAPVAVPVKAWHNHTVHVARHTSVMMDEEFDRLAVDRPEIVRLFDEHLAMHQQELQKQQMAQAQMLEAAKGAPDGPPGNNAAPSSPNGPPGPQGALPAPGTDVPMPDGAGTGAVAPVGGAPV
jgi:hypothetical protein